MPKKPDTWMPLYIGDYLRKTMHLSIDQHGAYLMLIMACWCDGGTLPNDDKHLASICHVPIIRWRKLRPAIERFFTIDETGWRNTRVTEELAKAQQITQQRRNAGRASVAARAATNAEQMLPSCSTSVATNAQQMGRPSPLGEGLKGTEGALGLNFKNNLPLSNNEYNSARAREAPDAQPNLQPLDPALTDGEGSFKKFVGSDPNSRFAASAAVAALRRDQLLQKLIRFSHATMAEPELTSAVTGLCGGDTNHGEQWWLDHLDKLMRAQHWDDTARLSA